MKRLMTVLYNLFFSIFFILVLLLSEDILVNRFYPMVAVMEAPYVMDYETFKNNMNKHIRGTNIQIARRVTLTNEEGQESYRYEQFGAGTLPKYMDEADVETAMHSSYADNYYVLHGNCSAQLLSQWLRESGFNQTVALEPNALQTVIEWTCSGTQGLAFAIFLLMFAALCVIEQMSEMRSAGIRIISGEKKNHILFREVLEDVLWIAPVFALTVSVGTAFILFSQQSTLVLFFFSLGIAFINICLLIVSALVSVLFYFVLQTAPLVQLIKGKVNNSFIFRLVLVGQLLSVIAVCWSTSALIYFLSFRRELKEGQIAWNQYQNVVTLHFNREVNNHDHHKVETQKKLVYETLVDAQLHNQILLSHYYPGIQESVGANKKFMLMGSSPVEKDTLIVSPNYLMIQNVDMDESMLQRVEHLNEGEFALLLPQSISKDQQVLADTYSHWLKEEVLDEEINAKMKPIVISIEGGKNCFLFNSTSVISKQFTYDPVLVVLSPISTGENAGFFWMNQIGQFLMMDSRDRASELIIEHGADNLLAVGETGRTQYSGFLRRSERETLTSAFGAVLAIATGFLLYNTLLLSYFERFRREIFVKRISGCTFFQQHRRYLVTSIGVILLGAILGFFITDSAWLSLGVLLFYGIAFWILLEWQNQKEKEMVVTILKGE